MGDNGLSQAGTTLLASALRMPILRGDRRCFYCASSCDAQFRASQYVRHSFTARDTVAGGEFVCSGCVASLNEKATVMLPDGTIRTRQKMRNYSWLLTPDRAIAATKSHRAWLLDQCLQPPDPPFVISISDSGQKQLLYRSRISHSRDPITVTLEGEVIAVAPAVLADRVWTCKRIAAVLGRPALSGLPTYSQQMKLIESDESRTLVAALALSPRGCCVQTGRMVCSKNGGLQT